METGDWIWLGVALAVAVVLAAITIRDAIAERRTWRRLCTRIDELHGKCRAQTAEYHQQGHVEGEAFFRATDEALSAVEQYIRDEGRWLPDDD